MKRVVLVAPEFPPANTAGAHRPRLFANHLREFGWIPAVLTIRRECIEGPLDPALEQLVAPDLDVVRTGALPVRPVRVVGDLGIRTLWPHARAIAAAARRGEVDAVVLFGPPWVSFALGPTVCRRRGLPYVLDYIDPWVSEWTASHRFPSKGWWYHRLALAVEPAAIRSAAHVTAVSPGILADLRVRYPALAETATTPMPYGAEPDDFAAAARLGVTPPDFDPSAGDVTMGFAGALQPTSPPLLRAVLDGVARLRASGSPVARRFRLRFYGTSNMTAGHGRYVARPAAAAAGVGDIVSEMPERIPYLSAIAVLQASTIVLVMGSTSGSYDASKLYPALVSGRPVLAICHAGSSIRRVMDETGAGECVTFTSPDEIGARAEEIRASIERLAQRPRCAVDAATIARFTARASTASLAAVLDRVVCTGSHAAA